MSGRENRIRDEVVTERKIDQRIKVCWGSLGYDYDVDSTIDLQVGISIRCPRPGKAANTPDAMLHDDAVCDVGIRGINLGYKL